ncbi:MAG: sulfite exporter TauE/SafE family protein [Pseudomonadota bacterium]
MGPDIAAALASPALWPLAGAAGLAGLIRGFTGFGAAMVFVPLAAIFLSPLATIIALLIMDVGASLMLIRAALPHAQLRHVGGLFAGAAVGLPLGVMLLERLDPVAFRWAAAAISLLALALLLSGWRYRGRPGPAATLGVGGVSGFLGGLTGLGGPPVILFFLGGPERAARVRASIIAYFIAGTVLGFIVFGWRGALTAQTLGWGLVLTPPFVAGTFVGARLFGLAGEAQFRGIAYAVITGSVILSLPLWG